MCEFCSRAVSWVFIDETDEIFLCNQEGCYIEAKQGSERVFLYAPLNIPQEWAI